MFHKVCLSEVFVGEQQITFWDNKASNEQGIWMDDTTRCDDTLAWYTLAEFKIKNGKLFHPCDDNY